MESTLRLILLLLVVVYVQMTRTQSDEVPTELRATIGSCDVVSATLFGSETGFSNIGVLPVNLIEDDGGAPPPVRITGFKILCEAIGSSRESASSVSVLLEYDIMTGETVDPGQQRQLSIDCQRLPDPLDTFYPDPPSNADGTDLDTTVGGGGVKRLMPPNILATLSTPTDRSCGRCVTSLLGPAISNVTNCERKL